MTVVGHMCAAALSSAFTFYNIMPWNDGREEESARDMVEYVERTGNPICLYSLPMHAEGRPATTRAMRMIECDYDGFPAFMLKLLRACYRTRDEALALVRAGDMVSIDFCLDFCETRESPDGSLGTSRAVPYRTDAVLAAAAGCGNIYAFDDETRLWHVWTSDGWRVDEDSTAPDLADMVEHLRARSEGLGDADVLPF